MTLTSDGDVRGAVQALLDRHSILDSLARLCENMDKYEVDAAVAAFSADCVTDYGSAMGGVLEGREALRRRWLAGHRIYRRTHHQLGQVRVELDEDTAKSFAYVTAWHEFPDGETWVAWLQYHDTWSRTGNGWLISHRLGLAAGLQGFDEKGWHRTTRRTWDD
jgi:hypothetical protein